MGEASFPNEKFINVMSDDGQRAFFAAKDALVPEDTNELQDVYEWHDGTVSLVSTGTATKDVRLLGASHSGDDVFFTTNQRLVGWDTDENVDVYDARVGGGFPEPPHPDAICEGEECRGAPTSAPPVTSAGSAVFEGPGNPPAPSGCPKGKARRHGRCVANKKHHKHRRQQRAAKHNRGGAR